MCRNLFFLFSLLLLLLNMEFQGMGLRFLSFFCDTMKKKKNRRCVNFWVESWKKNLTLWKIWFFFVVVVVTYLVTLCFLYFLLFMQYFEFFMKKKKFVVNIYFWSTTYLNYMYHYVLLVYIKFLTFYLYKYWAMKT